MTAQDPLPTVESPEPAPRPWWGDFELSDGQGASFRIGPFSAALRHREAEWQLSWEREGELQTDGVELFYPRPAAEVADRKKLLRIVPASSEGSLRLAPRLADRPVVARPETVFRLLPGSKICLFVSTPVWIHVSLAQKDVLDVPSWRLSETWFGSPQGDGELCWAIRTKARLHLDSLPVLPHRVITKVVFQNRAEEYLSLERLNLPVPNLSLYAASDARLWTQVINAASRRDGREVEVDIGQGPPAEAAAPELVCKPRSPAQRNIIVRTLDRLLQ